MLDLFLTVVFVYYMFLLVGYVGHRALHRPGWYAYKLHHKHHSVDYPPTALLTKGPFKADTKKEAAMFKAPVALIACAAAFWFLPARIAATGISAIVIFAFLAEYAHQSYHVKGCLLERVPLVRRVFLYFREQHFNHHRDTTKNLSIFCADLTMDVLAGTAQYPPFNYEPTPIAVEKKE